MMEWGVKGSADTDPVNATTERDSIVSMKRAIITRPSTGMSKD